MSTTTRARLLLTAAVAALAPTGAAVQTASAADSVERATRLLEGKRLTVYIPNENQTDSDIEHRIDFCARGRAFVRSSFDSGQRYQRSRGRWRVASAHIRRGVGWAKVRFDPGTQTAKVVIDRRGVRFLGHRAELASSPKCAAVSEPMAYKGRRYSGADGSQPARASRLPPLAPERLRTNRQSGRVPEEMRL